jgi:MHS family proline/betaine transporter-like MFS transporter
MMNTVVSPVTGMATGSAQGRKAVIAGTIGHILEWYDFAVYGYLAIHIAANIFPSHDETASLLASFGAFGIGFLARPLGGIFYGRLGDIKGRRAVLLWTLLLMAGSTLVIGLVPDYATVGILAPVLLVVARLAQGFSAGGETTAAAAFIVEWAPANRRGFYGSFQQVGSAFGLLLGTLTVAIISASISAQSMHAWGWRIPFLIGVVLAPIGFFIRKSVSETSVFHAAAAEAAGATIGDAMTGTPHDSTLSRRVVQAFLFTLFWSIGFYFFLSYMPTFAQRQLKLDGPTVFWISTLANFFYIACIPVFGALSDRFGRKPVLLCSCIGFAIGLVPAFSFLGENPSARTYATIICVAAVFLAMYTGPAAATLSEIFPTRRRSIGMAVGYSLSTVVFGGFTPFIATWLIATFHTPLAPIYYVSVCAVAGALSVAWLRETARDSLEP